MRRLDPGCEKLAEQLNSPNLSADEKKALETELAEHEERLIPMYHQVAIQFADLHDTPGRMEEKGVVSVCTIYLV